MLVPLNGRNEKLHRFDKERLNRPEISRTHTVHGPQLDKIQRGVECSHAPSETRIPAHVLLSAVVSQVP
jgi:hypothetical protein